MNPKDLSNIIAAHTAELRRQGLEAAASDLERLVEAREGILVDEAFGGIEMVDTELPKDADGNDIPPMDRVHADHRSEAAIRAQLHLDKINGLPERKDPLLLDVLTGRRHGDVRVAVDRASQNRDKPELGKLYTREELAKQFPARIGYGIRPGAVPLVNNTEPVETDPQTFGGIGVKAIQGLIDAEADRVIERSLQAAKDSKDLFVAIGPSGAYLAYDPSQPLDHPAMEGFDDLGLASEAEERAGAERFIAAMRESPQERHQRWLDDMRAAWSSTLSDEQIARSSRQIIADMNRKFNEVMFHQEQAESLLDRFARKLKGLFTTGKEP